MAVTLGRLTISLDLLGLSPSSFLSPSFALSLPCSFPNSDLSIFLLQCRRVLFFPSYLASSLFASSLPSPHIPAFLFIPSLLLPSPRSSVFLSLPPSFPPSFSPSTRLSPSFSFSPFTPLSFPLSFSPHLPQSFSPSLPNSFPPPLYSTAMLPNMYLFHSCKD